MTEHITEQPTYPPPILHNWELYLRERQRAEAIDAGIDGYEQQVADATKHVRAVTAECQQRIAEANQVYEQAKRAYAEQGRLHTLHTKNAAMHKRMVERECRDFDLPLPPDPPAALPAGDGGQTRPQALPAGDGRPVGVMAWQEAPAPDPLSDPAFNANDAFAPAPQLPRDIVPGDPFAIPANRLGDPDPQAGEEPSEAPFPPGAAQEAEGDG